MATNLFTSIVADNVRLARSRLMAAPSAGTYNLIRIPRYSFINNVWVNITTAYGAGGSITVGYSGNGDGDLPAYFMDESITDAGDTGMRAADIALYAADGNVIITVTSVTGAGAGTFMVFVQYTVIH